YRLTHKIESGKSTNFMVLAACFFLCLAFLYRVNRFSFRKKIWISALFILSPITVGELISYYVDEQLYLWLLGYLITAYFIITEVRWFYLLTLASLMILLINFKFTGVLFAGIATLGFLAILLYNRQNKLFKRVFITATLATAVGIAWAGYYPYVTNALHNGSPFYPVMGPSKKDIISNVYPESFKDMNRFQKFFVSFFSHTDELRIYEDKNPRVPPKIPFTFSKKDIVNAPKLGVKMAGFGPFFSGAFLLSLVLLVVLIRKNRERVWLTNIGLLLGTLLLSVFAVPEAWWARLVPQLWLFPLIIAYLAESDNRRATKWLKGIIYISLAVDILLASLILPWNLLQTEEVKYQTAQLKASGDTLRVEFSYFKSNRIRLREHGIPYVEEKVPDDRVAYLVRSSTKFEQPSNLPSLPRPWFLSMVDGVKRRIRK
ncbi:MAG TPA: hypothetical protein VMI35_06600, partial [Puia sp.]|nr:hypothetical protein [Puia sp.]